VKAGGGGKSSMDRLLKGWLHSLDSTFLTPPPKNNKVIIILTILTSLTKIN
jgi:hypothetical protein